MQEHGISTLGEMETYWVARIHQIVSSYNRTLMLWNDPFSNGATLPPDINIELWNANLQQIDNITSHGHPTVFAGAFYLDSVGAQWNAFYSQIIADIGRPPNPLYIGGETPMWGEYVDGTNIQPAMFPRATAIGELFWSPDAVPKIAMYQAHRLEGWRCRMRARGYDVAPCGTFTNTSLYCNPL
eukprot:TRINITY_DN4125_c1_g1_i2.p2 TRINITY_DN4125_c1_g1~~TRINITY_DN4125_c1_g1_i2.p2  ORF type:complete len:184 (+),score=70.10 TRINITY_DN4125_c1_g1_i2:649-1200(+)